MYLCRRQRVTSGQKEPHSSAQTTCNPQGEILLTFSTPTLLTHQPLFVWGRTTDAATRPSPSEPVVLVWRGCGLWPASYFYCMQYGGW